MDPHESAGVDWTTWSPYLKAPPLVMDKYIIFGPQGSGKGTQSELPVPAYRFFRSQACGQ